MRHVAVKPIRGGAPHRVVAPREVADDGDRRAAAEFDAAPRGCCGKSRKKGGGGRGTGKGKAAAPARVKNLNGSKSVGTARAKSKALPPLPLVVDSGEI